ncbi:MAG: FtsK/SpoIIIE domain-containing protein [Planctomycetota bacterium]
MQDHANDQANREPSPDGVNHHVLQRAAMRDLLELSDEPARTAESEIREQYELSKAAIEENARTTTARIERRLDATRTAGRQHYEGQAANARARFKADARSLEAKRDAEQQRIISQAEASMTEARKRFDQDVWLAESVAEATKSQLTREKAELKEASAARNKALDTVHAAGDHLLLRYRYEPPIEPQPDPDANPTFDDPDEAYEQTVAEAEQHLEALGALRIPGLFTGFKPHAAVIVLCVVSVTVVGSLTAAEFTNWPSFALTGPITLLAASLISFVVGFLLWRTARAQIAAEYIPMCGAIRTARLAIDAHAARVRQDIRRRAAEALQKRGDEIKHAEGRVKALAAGITQRRKAWLQPVEEEYERALLDARKKQDQALEHAEQWNTTLLPAIEERYGRYLQLARERRDRLLSERRDHRDARQSALEQRWKSGLANLRTLVEATARLRDPLLDWKHPGWNDWTPPTRFASLVRFGEMELDLRRIAPRVRECGKYKLPRPAVISAPAVLALPDSCSLFVESGRDGREKAIDVLRTVMARLLTALPPGRVRFTIFDPVGLGQNFAGFMHLADYEETLVGGRIWTDSTHIEQQLTDLTNHMENVIQKYLRNEFETIDAYNQQAGELAEPYRFLVVANFPVNFTEDAARRLSSIASSGARCGVFTLIAHDIRQPSPPGFEIEDLAKPSVHLVHREDHFVREDEVFRHFPLTIDEPPEEQALTRVLHRIGKRAKDAIRVEVPFEIIAPHDGQRWSYDCTEDLSVPIGRAGAARLQYLRLGRGVAQHALIAGKTGSGKSTLLHVIITNLALWYRPDDVEFYLIDFKKGVEFKTYAVHDLPHARGIAIESDREFGLSVLRRIEAEMERRGDVFRGLGVQDLGGYRSVAGNTPMPRTLLIIDEFQVFFSEDDKIAHDAAMLLDRLVRQGRAFGIHVLLGSQTLGGTSGLSRSTIGQMAVRVALQCSESDSQLILADDNTAARLLSRPGEAIYNDAGGLVEGNSPFQTAWLPESEREKLLGTVCELTRDSFQRPEPLIVFEGNAPADIRRNRLLDDLLDTAPPPQPAAAPRAWLGEAIAIKDPTGVTFRRQSGANLLIVGQRDDAAMAMAISTLVALAAHHRRGNARFFVLDGCPPDSPLAGNLERVLACLPHETCLVEWRHVVQTIAELAAEVRQRLEGDSTDAPALYLAVFGLQRYRFLRSRDDDFSFSPDDDAAQPDPGKQLAELLRDGPAVGVHVITWADAATSLERTFNRQALREFDNRVLFQMSNADSSNLIDSPVANQLGFYRAIFHSEELGVLEKFRPYALPEKEWLGRVKERLGRH